MKLQLAVSWIALEHFAVVGTFGRESESLLLLSFSRWKENVMKYPLRKAAISIFPIGHGYGHG